MLELLRELGDRTGEASTRYELAIIDRAKATTTAHAANSPPCSNSSASSATAAARPPPAFESRRDRPAQGDNDRASHEFTAVLELRRELGDRRGRKPSARH